MSDAAASEWRFYIDDMISFAEKVIAYTDGFDRDRFIASGLNYDATLRNLELIGEAASHVPDVVRAAHPQVPWRLVRTRVKIKYPNVARCGINEGCSRNAPFS